MNNKLDANNAESTTEDTEVTEIGAEASTEEAKAETSGETAGQEVVAAEAGAEEQGESESSSEDSAPEVAAAEAQVDAVAPAPESEGDTPAETKAAEADTDSEAPTEAQAEAEPEAPAETVVSTEETPGETVAEVQAPAQVQAEAEPEKPAETVASTEETPGETVAAAKPAEAEAVADDAKPVAKAKPDDALTADDSGEDDEDETQGKSFEELLEEYDQFRSYRAGDIVEGTIVSVGEQEVLVDIGARVEGMIPTSELQDEDGKVGLGDGEKVTVMVCRHNPDAQYIPLSVERARVAKVWDVIEEKAEKEEVLEGTVIEKVKGGFIVDVGVRAFLPTSQATLKPQKDYSDILGKKMEFSILKIQRRRGNLILSRRELLQVEYESKKKELFEKLQEGAVLQGTVKNITDYGVFIDLGGLDGLLHITDMSWGRVSHPKDMVDLGTELEVKVLRFDKEKEKVSLGLKQCTPDPWLSVAEKYPPGTVTTGKVLNLTSYGSFVELEPGVEGMIHVSELSWTKKIRNPAQVLSKGQEVQTRVLDLDSENRRVSLSMKQTEDNPWESLAERFPVGSKVTGKVRNITEFGAFVEIEDGIDGLVHVSDFHWGERNANPTEFVKKGDEVEVVILAVDTENHKVSLGIKQMAQDPWIEFTKKFKAHSTISATISKVTDFGIFVKLSEHVEGLVRQSELTKDDRLENHKEGEEIQVLITRISHRDRKVDLSVRRIHEQQERQAVLDYTKGNDEGGATMGDVFSQELRKFVK
jgi:small subunit ribosomal protein S1